MFQPPKNLGGPDGEFAQLLAKFGHAVGLFAAREIIRKLNKGVSSMRKSLKRSNKQHRK